MLDGVAGNLLVVDVGVGAGEDLNLISWVSKDDTYLFNFLKDVFKSKSGVNMCAIIPSCLALDHSSVTYNTNTQGQ